MKKVLLLISLILVLASKSSAQSTTGLSLESGGLAISPFLIETEAPLGAEVERQISIHNTLKQPLKFDVSVNDFVPDEKTGQVKFLPTGADADSKYSLSSWIQISKQPNYILQPGEETEIIFKIKAPKNAEPGTHYGGILFSGNSIATGLASVSVIEKVGAIILANVGKATQQGQISNFFINHSDQKAKEFILSFHNFGNVHLKPKGEIYISNIFGKQVGNLYINPDAQIVLPETAREFNSTWSMNKFTFGYFKATAVVYFGNPKLETRETVTFWVLPFKELLVGLVGLIGLAWLGSWLVRVYNRRLLRKNQ